MCENSVPDFAQTFNDNAAGTTNLFPLELFQNAGKVQQPFAASIPNNTMPCRLCVPKSGSTCYGPSKTWMSADALQSKKVSVSV